MRIFWAALPLLGFAAPAAAQRSLNTVWTVGESLVPTEAREVKRLDYALKHRLLPTGLAELSAGGPEGLTAGRQLIELQSGEGVVFCDAGVRGQKLVGHAQPCLIDLDSDGRFESMFLTSSITKGILTVQGKRPKKAKPIPPLAYRRIDPGAFSGELFVGLQYRGDANIFGNHVFEVKFGSEEKTGSLTTRLLHKKNNIPGATEFLGGRFTILQATPEGVRVRIDTPVPSQPFGVIQTTTYSFY